MVISTVIVLLVLSGYAYAYGPCSVPLCKWEPWKAWGSCSQTCGGGTRNRVRSMCCKLELVEPIDLCLEDCGLQLSGKYDNVSCNQNCASSSAAGPAVGGSAAVLIVIALAVGLIVLDKKGYSNQCKKKSNKYGDQTYENEVETNETRHEMSQVRASSTTHDEGQAAALPYEGLSTTRVTTSTIYDELNDTRAGIVGDTTPDGSVAGPYETPEPRQGENASFYEELKPHDDTVTEYENLKIK